MLKTSSSVVTPRRTLLKPSSRSVRIPVVRALRRNSCDGACANVNSRNAEVILTRMKVRDGRIVLPDGMSYRVLVLPQTRRMTPALLRKIQELVMDGATVVGANPIKSPSMQDFPRCDVLVRQIADDLWRGCDGKRIAW